jgi:hypothetical protein
VQFASLCEAQVDLVKSFLVIAGLAVLAAATPGCGDSKSKKPPTQATAPAKRPVPRSLDSVESSAEDIVDFARANARAKVVAEAARLVCSAEGPAAEDLSAADVPKDTIAALRDRARRVEDLAPRARLLQVALAASQVSGLMPDLFGRFSNPVPSAVLKLDYLDRDAQLRSFAGDRATVRARVGELGPTWASLRAEVERAGGRAVAARFTRHVAAMARLAAGGEPPALQREASRGLELVDRLEGVFRKG